MVARESSAPLNAGFRAASRARALLGETACVYITSRGESFWGKNLSMFMAANPQRFA
jgi:hypothetical protein